MKHFETKKPSTVAVMTRVSPELKRKLQDLARSMNRSEAYLAQEALAEYISVNEWQVDLIERRLAEAKHGGKTIAHAEVAAWVEAGGKARKPPKARTRRS